mmetsp:Transcript_39998/g.103310  ORF Transcript_39998/g.103310 Transcript_39998/m.103310 type:complete len:203 (-) Transcript_39998:3263-3871(-)
MVRVTSSTENVGRINMTVVGGIQRDRHKRAGKPKLIRMRKKYSRFFVTINTQQVPKSEEDADRRAVELEHAVQKFFAMMHDTGFGLKLVPDQFDSFNIRRINAKFGVEIGEGSRGAAYGRVHVHMDIAITHLLDDCKLDFAVIREFFPRELHLNTAIHLDVKIVPDGNRPMDYVEKHLDEVTEVNYVNPERPPEADDDPRNV